MGGIEMRQPTFAEMLSDTLRKCEEHRLAMYERSWEAFCKIHERTLLGLPVEFKVITIIDCSSIGEL